MEFTEGLRKVFLAGVGAVASTAENAKELIDDLVEKGELTVAQGRMLNEELKHTAKEKVKEHISVTVTRNYTDAMNSVDQMTEEELNALKEKIAQTEEARKEQPEDPDITSDECQAGADHVHAFRYAPGSILSGADKASYRCDPHAI